MINRYDQQIDELQRMVSLKTNEAEAVRKKTTKLE